MSDNNDLLQVLDELRLRLINSGVERTCGLKKDLGIDCSYHRKSLDIFLKRDYDELKVLIERANRLFIEIG